MRKRFVLAVAAAAVVSVLGAAPASAHGRLVLPGAEDGYTLADLTFILMQAEMDRLHTTRAADLSF